MRVWTSAIRRDRRDSSAIPGNTENVEDTGGVMKVTLWLLIVFSGMLLFLVAVAA
jgi:hypothetical protein